MEIKHSGPKIFLRDVSLSDVNVQYLKWMNDPEVNRYMETKFESQTYESIHRYVLDHQTKQSEAFLAICLSESGRELQTPSYPFDHSNHIGNLKIGPINPVHRSADISLFIGEKSFWGKGYGKDAVLFGCIHAFKNLNLHRLRAGVYAPNMASRKLFLSCGFEQEGIMKEAAFFEGEYVDVYIFGKTKE